MAAETDPKKPKRKLTVGIIGAGVCGLACVKICLENGLLPTCFDRSHAFGGLWRYKPDDGEQADNNAPLEPSVMRTTILNTSKETSAFSDFPPPARLPNFMKHSQYMQYIEDYVSRFVLYRHLRHRHEILKCWPEWRQPDELNSSEHIKWLVQARHVDNGEQHLYEFDRLMMAVGHHNIPFAPTYKCQDKFKGLILHSARLKDIRADKRLVDKRVLVIGLGNSACDAANDISEVASKCYVSCHRGQWFDGRYLNPRNRWQQTIGRMMPRWWLDRKIIRALDSRVNHKMLGLLPKHKPSELTPAINDLFPYRIITGAIVLKNAVERFTPDGVLFEGEEDNECQIDVAVLATGYEAKINCLDEVGLGIRSLDYYNEYDLFHNMFAPNFNLPSHAYSASRQQQQQQQQQLEQQVDKQHEQQVQENQDITNSCQPDEDGCCQGKKTSKLLGNKRRKSVSFKPKTPAEAIKSLAFIGLVQPNGSITAVAEMQARYACLIFNNQLELPSMRTMLKEIAQTRRTRTRAIRSHSRDQLVFDHSSYLDGIAKLAGVKPNLFKLFFNDIALWRALMFGPNVPYQYRLTGPGFWNDARDVILATPVRINEGINEGKNHILYWNRRKFLADTEPRERQEEREKLVAKILGEPYDNVDSAEA